MRAFDWSRTPLGPVAGWPQSLRTVVRIMLNSRYAMWLGWGPELTFFYNDAYAAMTLGTKHPWALGRPAREVWSEIWDDIGPLLRTGARDGPGHLGRGAAARSWSGSGYPRGDVPHLLVQPDARRDGGVGGMFCVGHGRHRAGHRRAAAADAAGPGRPDGRRAEIAPRKPVGPRPSAPRRATRTTCRSPCSTCWTPTGGGSPAPALAGVARRHAEQRREPSISGRGAGLGRSPRCSRPAGRWWSTTCPIGSAPLPRRRRGPSRRTRAVVLPMAQPGQARLGRVRRGRRQPPPAVRRRLPGLPRPARRPRRRRRRQRTGLRGGAAAGRGAGRAGPGQDGLLLQRQPRVPHPADAHARARSRTCSAEPTASCRRRRGAARGRPPQRAAAPAAGQHAAGLLPHRGGPGPGDATSRPTSPPSPPTSPASSARPSSGPGCGSSWIARRWPSRCSWTGRCGRRSS